MALGCFGAVACGSSSSGPDEEGDGQDGGADATSELAPVDARPSGPEGGSDGSSDAAADVVKPPAEAGTGYCANLVPKPRFCDDFDDDDLTDDWTASATHAGGVLELDETIFVSGPASFHLKTVAIAAQAPNNILLRSTMFGAVSRARLEFSANLAAVTFTKGVIAIARLDVAPNHLFTLYLRDGDGAAPAAALDEYVAGVTTRHLLAQVPPAGAWTRVAIAVDLTTGKADVSFGGVKALDGEAIAALAGSEVTVRLGAIIDGPADAFEARYDDVVIDF